MTTLRSMLGLLVCFVSLLCVAATPTRAEAVAKCDECLAVCAGSANGAPFFSVNPNGMQMNPAGTTAMAEREGLCDWIYYPDLCGPVLPCGFTVHFEVGWPIGTGAFQTEGGQVSTKVGGYEGLSGQGTATAECGEAGNVVVTFYWTPETGGGACAQLSFPVACSECPSSGG